LKRESGRGRGRETERDRERESERDTPKQGTPEGEVMEGTASDQMYRDTHTHYNVTHTLRGDARLELEHSGQAMNVKRQLSAGRTQELAAKTSIATDQK